MTDELGTMIETPPQATQQNLTVEQVNKIVQREKAAAAEKAKQEAEAKFQQEIAALQAQQKSMGGMTQSVDTDKIYEQVYGRIQQEQAAKQQQEQQAAYESEINKLTDTYLQKMGSGKDLYEDFEAVTAEFEPQAFPHVVVLASQLDNTPDVIYELSKNPQKLMTIAGLAERSPHMARQQLQRLSESIKQNQQAKSQNVDAPSPISGIKPSANAGSDGGGKTVRDLRKQPWLRG